MRNQNPLTFLFELWLPGNSVKFWACFLLYSSVSFFWQLGHFAHSALHPQFPFGELFLLPRPLPPLLRSNQDVKCVPDPLWPKMMGPGMDSWLKPAPESLDEACWNWAIHYPWDAGLWTSSLYNRGAVGSMWTRVERGQRRPNMGVKNLQLYTNPALFLPVVSLTHSHSLLRNSFLGLGF